jgi:hypothetical protein
LINRTQLKAKNKFLIALSKVGVYGPVPWTGSPTKRESMAVRNYLQESTGIFVDEPLAPLPLAPLPPALAINQQAQLQALMAQVAALVNQQQAPANHEEEEEEEEEDEDEEEEEDEDEGEEEEPKKKKIKKN